ncbi:MAG TPA: (E)-4-hydroxy-3-methylbut-2-enyl-diphosphate synthase [Marinilabiliaceae bacterium]|nr:(E)-4-hydroxy-3-methylbut-2-enyl-diphosphate synthase [Marinilabiliaceae bacterium]
MDNQNRKFYFCDSLFQYQRNKSREVFVGNVGIGGDNPLRLQSMTTTNTLDIDATANQCMNVYKVGAELMRITTQGRREATALKDIKEIILQKGFDFPLVADVHFTPSAANTAAQWVDKVRINPGNFGKGVKNFREIEFTDESYQLELQKIESMLLPLLEICKSNNTALRIGVNHGSLSNRIMSRFGDTPRGMVESCMEFLRICKDANFDSIVLSIKASNTRVMVHTVRLLVVTMKEEGFNFPLHLGVTEAGSGEDGRIKSAVGIGALLADGIGDTLRVSLTEDPELEIPVALQLKEHFKLLENHEPIEPISSDHYTPYEYSKRESHQVGFVGGNQTVAVIANLRNSNIEESANIPEAIIISKKEEKLPLTWKETIQIIPYKTGIVYNSNEIPLFTVQEVIDLSYEGVKIVEATFQELNDALLNYLKDNKETILLLKTSHQNGAAEQRAFFLKLQNFGLTHPVIISRSYTSTNLEGIQVKSAADLGILFLDGFGDGISLHTPNIPLPSSIELALGILQASRVRFSRTEFISCPGCGRTLFDLQATTIKIRKKTNHLKGLKIAIMGCIVNGIGEMADADYGYVGAGPGKISLYKNRELILKSIPQDEAVDQLIELIKQGGDWIDPEE